MNKIKIWIGIVVLVVIAGGALLIVLRSPRITNPQTVTTSSLNSTNKNYSLSEVSPHNNSKDCWTTINGNVYNLAPFINQHPGGVQAITSLCGIDGTNLFLGQHGGQAQPEAELKSLFIGKLK